MSLDDLGGMFDRFEHHQFPGFPDHPVLQEAYDELVEKCGRLTAVVQDLLTRSGSPTLEDLPTFDVDIAGIEDEDVEEFRLYREAADALVAKARELLEAAQGS